MIEEKEYRVVLDLRVTTTVQFSPIERETPITEQDAINNAVGSIPYCVFEDLAGEGFLVLRPIDGKAAEL